MYGDGGTVTVLEDEVRALLGKPAAVFMPSGTMIPGAGILELNWIAVDTPVEDQDGRLP